MFSFSAISSFEALLIMPLLFFAGFETPQSTYTIMRCFLPRFYTTTFPCFDANEWYFLILFLLLKMSVSICYLPFHCQPTGGDGGSFRRPTVLSGFSFQLRFHRHYLLLRASLRRGY